METDAPGIRGLHGNAGNTLDRWYHRSALCVWHRDQHFAILALGGHDFAVKLLASMVQKLKKTAKKRLPDAREDCLRLARSIIARWPRSHRHHYAHSCRDEPPSAFPTLLQQLDDPETTRQFLTQVGQRDPGIELDALIVAMCRKHGSATFAAELVALFKADAAAARPRDFVWLDRLASARLNGPDSQSLLVKLARLAETQFQQPPPQHYDADKKQMLGMLVALIRTLLVVGDDETLEHALTTVLADTKCFPLEAVQVPALAQLIGCCRKQRIEIHPRLTAWLRSVQQSLTTATSQEPQPPTDWARAAKLTCTCTYCRQLNALLADPTLATGRIKAPENDRAHLVHQLHNHPSDVDHKLERTGSPYALVFTKTQASYEKQKQRYAADLKLLKTVAGLQA